VTDVRAVLNDYARSPSREEAALDRVVRALVEHDDWYVPILLPGARPEPGEGVGRVVIFADPQPGRPVPLVVFTDRESALRADGQPLGAYRGGYAGTALFADLDPRWGSCTVNAYSPTPDQWFIAAGGFGFMKLFTEAVRVERELRAHGSFAGSALLVGYDAYMVALAKADGTLVEVPMSGGRRFGVIFTARDMTAGFTGEVGPEQAAGITYGTTSGERLVALMAQATHLDGLLVNPWVPDRELVLFRDQF
jgi:hypothetical protein